MKNFNEILENEKDFMEKLKTESCTSEFKKIVHNYVSELVHELACTHDQLFNTVCVLEKRLDITNQQIELLATPINEIEELSTRTVNCLARLGIRLVNDLICSSKSSIMENYCNGFGPASKQEVLNFLEELEKQGLPIKE